MEKEFDALYNRAPLGYHTLDLSGAVVDINDTEMNWLGYSRDEIIGKRYGEFLDETSWAAFSENYGCLLNGDRSTRQSKNTASSARMGAPAPSR